MDINVIHWKLNEIMARKRIRNKDLAKALSITENSVYRLRKTDRMPRLSPERLNGICTFLGCQPGELLEWTLDEYPLEQFETKKRPQKNQIDKKQKTTDSDSATSSSGAKSNYRLKSISNHLLFESA
jgi:putative transcriptional regulator